MANDTDVNTFMASLNWKVNSKFSVNFGVAYSMADMEMDDVSFPSELFDTDATTLPAPTTGDPAGTWAGAYNPANMNKMDNYSDLEYDIIDVNLGASYAISDKIGVTVSYIYEDVDNDESYVYGDEEGTYQSLMTYLTVKF